MTDDMLIAVICAGGKRWRSLLTRAIASRLGRAAAGDNEAFEDHVGPLEDSLLDTACAIRGVRAALAGCGDVEEALVEAGASIVRLSVTLVELRNEAVASATPQLSQ